jgi:ABC-type branched-subunit amino acid transport system substrate-binding protein
MFRKILILFGLIFATFITNAIEFKVAIFDNPEIDSTNVQLSQNLQNSYMQGVYTAIHVGNQKNVNINQKSFFYTNNLMDIMQQSSAVNEWGPQVIIGLNSSNSMLMAKNNFSTSLVLSISASDVQLEMLPNNFYTLAHPDRYSAKILVDFIKKSYPNKNIFILTGAESKESVDFSQLLSSYFEKENPKLLVKESQFLSDDLNTMDIPTLVKGYTPGDIIFLLSIAGTYNTQVELMNKIASYLKPQKLIFITPIDNWKGDKLLSNIENTTNPYEAYRFDTLYVNENSPEYKAFAKNFEDIYHTAPTDKISYITYRAVMSVVIAIEKYPPPKNLSAQAALLWSYQQALKHNPNWFRPEHIALFKIGNNQEKFVKTLD